MKKVFITLAAFAALGLGAAFAQVSGESCTSVTVNGQTQSSCTPVTSNGDGTYSSGSSTTVTSGGGIQNCTIVNNVVVQGGPECQALLNGGWNNGQQGNNGQWDWSQEYDYDQQWNFDYSDTYDWGQ
jgi:hypothetical protein